MHPENAIDNGDFIKILVYKFILSDTQVKLIKGYCQKTSLCQSKK